MAKRNGSGDRSQGVQSVEIGFKVLTALANLERAAQLKDIARAVGMSTSSTHRYLVSLVRAGVVTQSHDNGYYDLGSGALNIGLSAIARIDAQKVASDALEAVFRRVGHTVALIVWGNRGATIIRWKEAVRAVTVNARAGHSLPTLTSASGRLFAAFLPEETVAPFIYSEFQAGLRPHDDGRPLDEIGFRRLREKIRERFAATVEGDLLPDVNAIACPVFNHDDQIIFAIAVWDSRSALKIDPESECYIEVREAARVLSRRLGYTGPYPGDDAAIGAAEEDRSAPTQRAEK